jgi:hypothetical protein
MSTSIVITLPHRLGAEEAKRPNFRVGAFGQTATAQLYVMSDAVRIEVQLPWILAALTSKIQGVLKTKAEESLRIVYTPPKT